MWFGVAAAEDWTAWWAAAQTLAGSCIQKSQSHAGIWTEFCTFQLQIISPTQDGKLHNKGCKWRAQRLSSCQRCCIKYLSVVVLFPIYRHLVGIITLAFAGITVDIKAVSSSTIVINNIDLNNQHQWHNTRSIDLRQACVLSKASRNICRWNVFLLSITVLWWLCQNYQELETP